jgi:hypothetical protein
MSGETTPSVLTGFLKPVFGKLAVLLPEEARLQDRFKFNKGDLLGDSFQEPVQLKAPWGITAGGSAGGAFSLNGAINSVTENAKVSPYTLVARDQISYGLIDRSEGDRQAFMRGAEYVARGLTTQLRRVIEILMLHGQEGIGTVQGNISSQTATISDASFSAGIMSILEGAVVDVYQSDLATVRQAGLTVSAVDLSAKTVTFTGTATGITTGDVLFLKGFNNAGSFNEMPGFGKLLAATTGTVQGVNKATYSLWRANQITTAGNFSASLLLDAAQRCAQRGYNGKMVAVMPPKAWRYLAQSEIAQQIFTNGDSAAKTSLGTDSMELRHDGLRIELMSHPFQKDGKFYVLAEPFVKRLGAVDIAYTKPNPNGGDSSESYFEAVPGVAAYEMQARSDQAVFVERPAYCAVVDGITYA